MGLFSGFNQLTSAISSVSSKVNQFQNTFSSLQTRANSALGGLNSLGSAAKNFGSNPSLSSGLALLNQAGSVAQDFSALGATFSSGFGSRTRLGSVYRQGVTPGAEPFAPNAAMASIISQNVSSGGIDEATNDWRVSLSVPYAISGSPLFQAFNATSKKLVFPFTPTILFGNSANYSQIHPTHVNYPYNAYENSQVDSITVTGEFFAESEEDAFYWIAVLHYLRTMTKMFYGDGLSAGNPPLVARLNGYGRHVLNNVPVLVGNFTTDLPAEVDYIQVKVQEQVNYVPVQSTITVTLLPQYSRSTQAQFNLRKFANGEYTSSGTEGFI